MRLDVYLTEKGIASSRTEAKGYILSGAVAVGGKTVTKPSFDVDECIDVVLTGESKRYVSRGGLKLEGALEAFSVSPKGRYAVDIGASSGGFTDCLLQNGALHVTAVDSGKSQLASSLRCDSRVTVMEGYNARYLKSEDIEYIPTLAVMDVSFISATYIIGAVYDILAPEGDFICLIKPQFEVGKSGLGKGGIVKSESARKAAVDKVVSYAESVGFKVENIIKSPIEGGDGNVEFLAHMRKCEYEKNSDNNQSE